MKDQLTHLAKAAKGAGHLIIDLYRKNIALDMHEDKTHDGSYSLAADVEAEKYIISYLKKNVEGNFRILSEESSGSMSTDGFTLVIDPIDGTYNYSRGLGDFAISIGVIFAGKSVGGVVFLPHYNELYSAWSDAGAFCNGLRLHFNPSYPKPLVGFDGPHKHITPKFLDALNERLSWKKSMSQVATQMHVAKGRLDACYIEHPYPWDIAASVCIMKEAGVEVVDRLGHYPAYDADLVVAGTSDVVEKLLELEHQFH